MPIDMEAIVERVMKRKHDFETATALMYLEEQVTSLKEELRRQERHINNLQTIIEDYLDNKK